MGTSLKIYLWRFSPQEFIEIFNNSHIKRKENNILQEQNNPTPKDKMSDMSVNTLCHNNQ